MFLQSETADPFAIYTQQHLGGIQLRCLQNNIIQQQRLDTALPVVNNALMLYLLKGLGGTDDDSVLSWIICTCFHSDAVSLC